MSSAYLEVRSLGISLGGFSLRHIDFFCEKGEYHVLLGPTGSGKSTLMKCILGFYQNHEGAVFLNGQDISGYPPEARRMGYVPQNYSLFPHLNVEENIRFGVRCRKKAPTNGHAVVDRLCEVLNIEDLRKRSIRNLSGGERQKVALARALAIQPDMVFLDEPFSSIDEGSRRDLWVEMKKIINEIGITAFHITHNLEEAYSLGERLSVLLDGEIHQSGPKEEIFEHPVTRSVARFLNYRNIFTGTARPHSAGTRIDADAFSVVVSRRLPAETAVDFCMRQQDIKIIKEGRPLKPDLQNNVFSGRIVSLFPFPEYCLIYFKIDGSHRPYDFEIKLPPYLRERYELYEGKEQQVAFWEPNIILFADH